MRPLPRELATPPVTKMCFGTGQQSTPVRPPLPRTHGGRHVTPLSTIGYMSSIGQQGGGDGAVMHAFVQLLVAEPDDQDRTGLDGLVRRSLRVRSWLDAMDARIATRAADLAARGEGDAPATVLAGGDRRGKRDAEAAAARGAVCTRMPAVADALAAGSVTAGHVDAIGKAVRTARRRRQGGIGRLLEGVGRGRREHVARAVRPRGRRSRPLARRRRRTVTPRTVAPAAHRASLGGPAHRHVQDVAQPRSARRRQRVDGVQRVDRGRTQRSTGRRRTDSGTSFKPTPWSTTSPAHAPVTSTPVRGGGVGAHRRHRTARRRLNHSSSSRPTDGQPLPVGGGAAPRLRRRHRADLAGLAPAKCSPSAGNVAWRPGHSAQPCGRCIARAGSPACTVGFEHCRIHHVTYWERLGRHRPRQPDPDL